MSTLDLDAVVRRRGATQRAEVRLSERLVCIVPERTTGLFLMREGPQLGVHVAESDSIRYLPCMKTLSVTEVARNFSAVLDSVARKQEEIVLVRNRRQVARLVPEPPHQDALEVFGDLFRTLDDATAEALTRAISTGRTSRRGRVSELKTPWGG